MSNTLQVLSHDIAAVVEAAAQSLVRVEARARLPASGVVWADGVIVTAHHVVEDEENIHLGLPNGQKSAATFVGRDPSTDLAVLRTDAAGLKPATPAQPDSLRVGHFVLALGRPGDSAMASLGIIYALDNEWRTPAGGLVDRWVQASITMYPGFSGGPLVNADGQLIGINTSGLLRGMHPTLPATTVRRVVETLLAHGRVRRAYLGITTQPVRLPAPLASSLGQETGLLIVGVEPDSPADRGGLLLGDVVVALGESPIRHMDDLFYALSGDIVNRSLVVRLVRGGQLKEIPVVAGERQ